MCPFFWYCIKKYNNKQLINVLIIKRVTFIFHFFIECFLLWLVCKGASFASFLSPFTLSACLFYFHQHIEKKWVFYMRIVTKIRFLIRFPKVFSGWSTLLAGVTNTLTPDLKSQFLVCFFLDITSLLFFCLCFSPVFCEKVWLHIWWCGCTYAWCFIKAQQIFCVYWMV